MPLNAKPSTQVLVPESISLAWRLGRAVALAHRQHADPVEAVLQVYGSGRLLFRGKVRPDAWLCMRNMPELQGLMPSARSASGRPHPYCLLTCACRPVCLYRWWTSQERPARGLYADTL